MNRMGSGPQLILTKCPVTHRVSQRARINAETTSGRQAPVENGFFPEICAPVPDVNSGILSEECNNVQESPRAGPQNCANSRPTREQRGGRRVQRRKRAIAGAEVRTSAFLMSTAPFAHADRSFCVSRWKVGKVAIEAEGCVNSELSQHAKKNKPSEGRFSCV